LFLTKFIKKKDVLFLSSISILYSILTLIGVLNHEPWRDEAQVWLIVRDLNFSEIFSQFSVQGNLFLWYLILLPFAKLGFPYITIQIIHWLISVSTATIFIFKAPLSKITKVVFVFSYWMIFEYGVVARDYMLTVLFLFLIASYYNTRFTNPKRHAVFIFFLFNCHILGFGAALALSIIYFIEKKNVEPIKGSKVSLSIIILGLLVFIAQLLPSNWYSGVASNETVPATYLPTLDSNAVWTILTSVENAFIPTSFNFEEIKLPLFFFLALGFFFISLIRKPFAFIFLMISVLWLFYVFITKQYYERYTGLILVFIIFTMWLKEYYVATNIFITSRFSNNLNQSILDSSFNTFLVLSLIVNSMTGLSSIRKEYLYSFSGANEVATYINKQELQNNEFATYRCWSSSIAAYLPKTKIWSIDMKRYETYFILDSTYKNTPNFSEVEILNEIKLRYKKEAFLLMEEPLLLEASDSTVNVKLLFHNQNFIWQTYRENYFLYKITMN